MSFKKYDTVFTKFKGENVPEDFSFPSIELEDIDRAVFDLFDKNLNLEVEQRGDTRKIPVIFSTGERFALSRRKNAIRDSNDTIILPLISINRGTIDTSSNQHGKGTAIAYGDNPGYYVKRKLSKKDRNYQNIINKMSIKNQDNVASRKNFGLSQISPGNTAKKGTIASRIPKNNNSFFDQKISLEDNLGDNIFEIIEVPYPKFTATKYEVTFWCQYMTQMNQILQNIFIQYGQGHEIPIQTQQGFEMLAFFSDNILLETNFSSFTDDERLIKYKMEVTVNGYVINAKSIRGMPILQYAHSSAPRIDFGYYEIPSNANVVDRNIKEDKNKFILSEIKKPGETSTQTTSVEVEYKHINPFTKESETKYSKVLTSDSRSGETVLSPLLIKKITRQFE